MAFTFGNIKDNTKAKDLVKATDAVSVMIADHHFDGQPTYIFLVDKQPAPDTLQIMLKRINESYSSYYILNAVDTQYDKDELHGNSIVEFICQHRSKWRSYLNDNIKGIMTFGPAMYSINCSSDVIVSDFYDTEMLRSYYYMGDTLYKYNTHIFPVDSVDELFPKASSRGTPNFKTKFFYKQLQIMKQKPSWTPIMAKPKVIVISSKEEADKVFKDNMNAELVAFDTETSGFLFYKNHIHCLTITWDGVKGYYIPWSLVDRELLAKNLMSCKRRTGANPKFDIKFFWSEGVPRTVNVTDATDRCSHCIASDLKSGLKPLAYRYTQFGGYDIKLDQWKKQTGCDDYTKVPADILSQYATMDAIVTWRIQKELWAQMDDIDRRFPNEKYEEWTIRRWYETQMMEIYKEIINVEWRGIYVNWDLMNEYRQFLVEDLLKKKEELMKAWNVPSDFKFSSSTEVGKLFEKLGFKCYGRNANGVYLTDENAMAAWIREDMPGVKILSEYRTEKTSLGSFLGLSEKLIKDNKWPDDLIPKEPTGWLQYIYHDTNDILNGDPAADSYRVEQSYLVMNTETFRFIGKDPNFQNIPTRNEYAKYVKRCIDTPPADLYIITGKDGKEYKVGEFELVYTNEGYKTVKECFSNMRRLQFIDDDPSNPPVKRMGFDKQSDGSFSKPDKSWYIA